MEENRVVIKQGSKINGQIKAPTSKSYLQRAIAAAMLADGKSILLYHSLCNDTEAAIQIAKDLGAQVLVSEDKIIIEGGMNPSKKTVNCGESGLAIRMFSPIAALNSGDYQIDVQGSLQKRPLMMIEDAINALGGQCTTNNGFAPLVITDSIKGGRAIVDGSLSSQLLTGLLMALPLAENDSELIVTNLKSKPYIDLTIQVLKEFGITVTHENYELFIIKGKQKYISTKLQVEADWSGVAFLLIVGAIGGEVEVMNISSLSKQSDVKIIDILKDAGAKVELPDDSIKVRRKELKSFTADATDCPDLFPPLVALAAHCEGRTVIKGVNRLKHKESDRAATLTEEFRKLGINIYCDGDVMYVEGGKVKGATVHSHNDHRIAMALATTAILADGDVIIEDPWSINKSYPGFYEDLQKINASIF